MSAFYQISYDPKSIMNDALLVDRIKQYGVYCNILPGTWLIYTTDDAKEIYERITRDQYEGMLLIVCKLDMSSYWGRMDKSLWEWIRKIHSK